MPYTVIIEEQDTKKVIRKEIETLEELKFLLLEYQEQLINFEMHEIKKGERNDIYKRNKIK